MSFKKYIPRLSRRASWLNGTDLVSLKVVRHLYVPKNFLKKHGIEFTKYAELFIDQDKLLLGIKFLPRADREGCVSVSDVSSGVSINITSLLEEYPIDFPVSDRVKAAVMDAMVVVRLERTQLEGQKIDEF